jgi:hypothetical protein
MWQRLDKRKISCDFAVLGRVMRNRGRFIILDSSGVERRVAVICLTLKMSKPRLTRPSEISSAAVLSGRWRITSLMGFSDFGDEGVVGQVWAVKVGFHGLEIRHAARDDSCSVSCATELELFIYHTFSCVCSRIKLTADVRIIVGGPPALAGAASCGVALMLAESVSMSDARRGAKKFRMATSLGGKSTAVHADFFEVGAVSFVRCRLRLRTSLKPSS